MSDSFKDVPEFFEAELGESLTARTETLSSFRELGPPDLCQVVKSMGKSGQKDISSYHFVSGVEASSSASLAAYLNSLTYAVEDASGWLSKGPVWKVRSGSYCCYNAFSRVDVRVDVKIPGGVNAYVVDLRGERHDATPEVWQETALSAILRAILYADDANYRLMGYRKLDPITTPESELRFLQVAEALFEKGWQLGSEPEIQVATLVSNHLAAGIMKYFGDAYRFDQAANLFEKLYHRGVSGSTTPEGAAVGLKEVAPLLAMSYIGMNEEVKAIQIISEALRENPQSYHLLHVQCDFLRSKGKYEWALKLARQAVNCAPSEFVTWAKLTEVYIELEMYDWALLTLNSCPMFTYNERDLHRMPTPQRTHLPVKQYVADSKILEDDGVTNEDVDPALTRLPAPALRGTFARAYSLLTRLVSKIGWDELLKTRSAVFVMEEEYRQMKAESAAAAVKNGTAPRSRTVNGVVVEGADDEDNASTRGMTSPKEGSATTFDGLPQSPASAHTPIASPRTPIDRAELNASPTGVPVIKVSNARENEAEGEIELERDEEPSQEEDVTGGYGRGNANGQGVGKPETAAVPEEGETPATPTVTREKAVPEPGEPGFSFSNKRLCERWLDNLFMVLYEDLRIWTIFRAEVAHFKNNHLAYRKTGIEWEILGDLGIRLHHKEEAKEAYLRCLDSKFSAKAWMKLLELHADEGDLARTLNAAIRLTTYQHRWYMELSYPTTVAHQLYKIGQIHGQAKISYTLMSMSLPPGILKIMEGYIQYGQKFKVEGWDF